MAKRIGPSNHGGPDDVRAALQCMAWEIDGQHKPINRSADAKPEMWQRAISDAMDLIDAMRRGVGLDAYDPAALESLHSRLEALSPQSVADDLREAFDAIADLQETEETLTTEKQDLESKLDDAEAQEDVDAELQAHGWSLASVETALWRHGIISTGETVACGLARMMDDLDARPKDGAA